VLIGSERDAILSDLEITEIFVFVPFIPVLELGMNKEIIMALVAGLIVGVVFRAVKLPLPAPPVLAGIVGIIGIYLGGQCYDWFISKF